MFRFTPTPVSSASVFWWCGKGGFAHRKCTLDDTLDRWFDDRFPPLSIYYGGRDYLVLTEPLLERLEQKETDVKVIRVEKLDVSEVSGLAGKSSGRTADRPGGHSTVISTGLRKPSNGFTTH